MAGSKSDHLLWLSAGCVQFSTYGILWSWLLCFSTRSQACTRLGLDCSGHPQLHGLHARWCGRKASLQNQFHYSAGGAFLTMAWTAGHAFTFCHVYSISGWGSSGFSVSVLYLLQWVVWFSFILSHWEKCNTGILFLPWGYDMSRVTISFVYRVTAVVGVEAW